MDVKDLFGDDPISCFEAGLASHLTVNRESALGQLLVADRAVYYINILYRMRLFRGEHELEPLYEDLYEAVVSAQEIFAGESYSGDQFRIDLNQLTEWLLITSRIEKQRIRGYKDNRKKKYRYCLTGETLAFLIWLEERLQDDLEGGGADARNQLEDVSGTLRELLRLLHVFRADSAGEEEARRILYQLFKLDEMTTAINSGLSELNARLLAFVTLTYDLDDVKQILSELEAYVERFLRQVRGLRHGINTQLDRLQGYLHKMEKVFEIMETERRKAPHLIRRNTIQPVKVVARLNEFYREGGFLDRTCRRLDTSSLNALRKMYAHLREMERKNHRMEDLSDRMWELSRLDEDQVPHAFFRALISSAHGRFDQHDWNEGEKADPPKPRTVTRKLKQPAKNYMGERKPGAQPTQTMEQARLERLKRWLETTVMHGQPGPLPVSGGAYSEFDDFPRLLALARAGLLSRGRKLGRIGYGLAARDEKVTTQIGEQALSYGELEVWKK